MLHEGSKVLQEAFIYFLCSGFWKKDMLFTHVFFMDVNANFVGELLSYRTLKKFLDYRQN